MKGEQINMKRVNIFKFTGFFFWFALTAAFCAMGFSQAAFTDQLELKGSVATGDISPKLANQQVRGTSDNTGKATITNNADEAFILSIIGAHPGDTFYLNYTVLNEGTIPVQIADVFLNYDGSVLNVSENNVPENVLKKGDALSGSLIIIINDDVEEMTDYKNCLRLELLFKQWNMAN